MNDVPEESPDPVGTCTAATADPTRFQAMKRRIGWWWRDLKAGWQRHREVMKALGVLRTGTEAQLRALKMPWPRSEGDMRRIIQAVSQREHDYGTCVYAMSIAAEAAFHLVAHRLGVTGFQASCADLDFLRRLRGYEMGFRVLNYENLLYPQYADREHFPTHADLTKENIERLGKRAAELLAENERAHPNVRRWWEDLADRQRFAGAAK